MADHRTPFTLSGERQTLLDFLNYLRECVVRKTSDLDEDTVRRPGVASGTSLLGLVKHLTVVEIAWFQWCLSLRWILVHMVEETGRHAGHADILREQIDGVTGR